MTKDKIIRMAREAGASDLGINAASPNVAAMFERFAALASQHLPPDDSEGGEI